MSILQRNAIFNLLSKLGIVLFFLEFYRILLLLTNPSSFPNFGFYDHLIGIWFDIITVALYFLPVVVFSLLPLPKSLEKSRTIFLLILFSLTSFVVYLFNAIDVAYFNYVNKRSSYNYLIHILTNEDSTALAGDFFIEFWWLVVLFVLSMIATIVGYLKNKNVVYYKISSAMRKGIEQLLDVVIDELQKIRNTPVDSSSLDIT